MPAKYVLFDVVNDPEEQRDLSSHKPELFEQLKHQLAEIYNSANKERKSGKVLSK